MNIMNFQQDVNLKRKFRWTFEGKNEKGEIIFPESFVKVDRRPPFPYYGIGDEKGGHFETFPESNIFYQYFNSETYGDRIKEEFSKFDRAYEAQTGVLRLYDSHGVVIEQWNFYGVTLRAGVGCEFEDDYIIAEWVIDYKAAEIEGLDTHGVPVRRGS
jgi:hypothetical protein